MIALLDVRRGDDVVVEDDREEVADVLGRVVGELGLARVAQGERDGPLAGLPVDGRVGALDLVAAEEGRLRDRQRLAFDDAGRPAAGRGLGAVDVGRERHEVEPAGRPDELLDRLRVLDARQLDHDPVRADGVDERLRHAGRVDPALDDVADRVHGVAVGDPVADLLGLVLDPEPALEVEAQLPLELARVGRAMRAPR